MKSVIAISVLVTIFLTTGTGCVKRVLCRPPSIPRCQTVVDSFLTNFREPTPKEFDAVLECVELLRAGY